MIDTLTYQNGFKSSQLRSQRGQRQNVETESPLHIESLSGVQSQKGKIPQSVSLCSRKQTTTKEGNTFTEIMNLEME